MVRVRGAKKEVTVKRELLKHEREKHEAASQLQCFARTRAAKLEADERRKRKGAAVSAADACVNDELMIYLLLSSSQ